jgi:hypothetical protein
VKEQRKVFPRFLLSKIAAMKHYCADKNDSYCVKLAKNHFMEQNFFGKK